jgi:hypothetical protein
LRGNFGILAVFESLRIFIRICSMKKTTFVLTCSAAIFLARPVHRSHAHGPGLNGTAE